MPNSIDFQVGSKFMELAGGVEVNNLQEAIKKAKWTADMIQDWRKANDEERALIEKLWGIPDI